MYWQIKRRLLQATEPWHTNDETKNLLCVCVAGVWVGGGVFQILTILTVWRLAFAPRETKVAAYKTDLA